MFPHGNDKLGFPGELLLSVKHNYFDVLCNRKNGLGYTPNSTPEEITNEYSGHKELLRSALAESWRAK
jgi:hypothetical protein